MRQKSLWRDVSGQALSEYGLLIAVLVVGVFALAMLFRDKLGAAFRAAASDIDTAVQTPLR
ncbi:MAG: hypothetical protein HYV42_03270 [Candidatus Magasanikbacteria bacterium]|nr:hypothetical protein [Candidatus Magasanikbacteria bacterium]